MADIDGDRPPEQEQWVWVVVQDPGGAEQLLGQHDTASGISFIPAFLEKEAAQLNLGRMAREQHRKFEIQAIIFEDLQKYAAANNTVIFFLDEAGAILKRV